MMRFSTKLSCIEVYAIFIIIIEYYNSKFYSLFDNIDFLYGIIFLLRLHKYERTNTYE